MCTVRKTSIYAGQNGSSLIELMIGIALGLMVIAAVTTVFVNSSRSRTELEKTSQQIENGRYATQLLLDELRLAGYYGELMPSVLNAPTPLSKPDPCATDAVSLKAALALPIQGYDNVGALSCISDVKAGTDVVVIRRASTCVAGSAGCEAIDYTKSTYFQTALCSANVGQYVIDTVAANFILKGAKCTTVTPAPIASQRHYYTRIFFVAQNNNPGDGIPTLKVAELGSGSFTVSALVAGIEQLQLEYGIDIGPTLDGVPDVYTADPDLYASCAGAACQTNWRNVMAVKVHVLARNTQPTPGFSDKLTYVLGQNVDGTDNIFGPANDTYKRHAYTTLVRINNIAGRLE